MRASTVGILTGIVLVAGCALSIFVDVTRERSLELERACNAEYRGTTPEKGLSDAIKQLGVSEAWARLPCYRPVELEYTTHGRDCSRPLPYSPNYCPFP